MNIGIDIDNVISNFNEMLIKEFLIHDKELRGTGIINPKLFVTRGMFDWNEKEIYEFYNTNIERIAKNLGIIENAPEYINKLKAEGHKIYIITGRDNGEYSNPYKMTRDWLKKYNINYDELLLTNAYNSSEKAIVCLGKDIDIMIDDSIHVCNSVNQYGIEALLMDTDFNKQYIGTRVYNWKEIYEFISNYKKEKVNVILDTDTYNECDDQFALAYMLKNQDIFNIEAITVAPFSHESKKVTIKEGQDLSYKEIIKICNWLNFDSTNKVFRGSMDYMQNGYNENNDAVNKIIKVALKNDKTYILGIGAITNIGLAIKKEPKIIDKLEVVWLGGNEINYKNNLEYNFKQDVEAVKNVFDSKVKLTILPCKEVVSRLKININILKQKLGNKSELCNYLIERFYNDGYHGIQEERVIWDIAVIAYMINKKWFETQELSCPKIKENTSYEMTKNNHKITFITKLNKDKIYEDLFEKLGE